MKSCISPVPTGRRASARISFGRTGFGTVFSMILSESSVRTGQATALSAPYLSAAASQALVSSRIPATGFLE